MLPIETERLLLLPWTADDVGLLRSLSSDARVTRYTGLGRPWPAARVIEIADRSLAHWHEHGFGWRPLLDKASGAKFGILMVNVMGDDAAAGVPGDAHEIGWWVHPDWWGAGYAREAAKAAAEYHFRELAFPELTARIQPPNTASIRVALSLGMTHRFDTTGRFGEACAIYQVERPDAA